MYCPQHGISFHICFPGMAYTLHSVYPFLFFPFSRELGRWDHGGRAPLFVASRRTDAGAQHKKTAPPPVFCWRAGFSAIWLGWHNRGHRGGNSLRRQHSHDFYQQEWCLQYSTEKLQHVYRVAPPCGRWWSLLSRSRDLCREPLCLEDRPSPRPPPPLPPPPWVPWCDSGSYSRRAPL